MAAAMKRAVQIGREQLVSWLACPETIPAGEGGYLPFLMIPLAARFGQWRFAGAARTLPEALVRLGDLIKALYSPVPPDPPLHQLLDFLEQVEHELDWAATVREAWSDPISERQIPATAYVFLAVGGAPMDDVGIALARAGDLRGHPYEARRPESRRPLSWEEDADAGAFDRDFDADPDAWLA